MAGSITRTKPDLVVGCRSFAMVRSADSASSIIVAQPTNNNQSQHEPTKADTSQQRDTCFYHDFTPKATFVNIRQQKPTLRLCSNEGFVRPKQHICTKQLVLEHKGVCHRSVWKTALGHFLFMWLGRATYTIVGAT